MSKSIWRSKTMLTNALALGIGVYQYFISPIPGADPQLFALAVAMINLALRFTTSVPVTL